MPKPTSKKGSTRIKRIPGQRISIVRLCLLLGAVAAAIAFVSPSFFSDGTSDEKKMAPASLPVRSDEERPTRPTIKAVRLIPTQPGRKDSLRAEIDPANSPGGMTCTYVWKVNGEIIEGATTDTLNLATMKKRDLITVAVTPYDGNLAGYPVESSVVAIHGAPPTLELSPLSERRKTGEPIKLQLLGQDAEGGPVTFSLVPPLVPGMSIDGLSGKITWIVQPNPNGTVRFGAAAEDADRTKVSKIFEITVQ